MKHNFYVTTPLYYVNATPHLGHAYTTVAADCLARHHRLKGQEVLFLTGSDEHGNKILRSARAQGITPQELADGTVAHFQDLWNLLAITNDDFIRTSEPRHTRVVGEVLQTLWEQGDIYAGHYEGWYCVPCESFWLESQLLEGNRCPDCGREAEVVREPSYFFRLSAYQKPLLSYYASHPEFVLPDTRMNEVIEFVRRELKDLSITRLDLEWGIPSPMDPHHTVYVWVDALMNYISALGYGTAGADRLSFWPADLHLVGKDILKFHAIIWPALLMALGLELPHRVFAHGWWKVNGRKMSKSQGRVVDPFAVVRTYGSDQLRYFLLREVPFGDDGTFSDAIFIKRINSDLANDLGNLLNRTLTLLDRYCQGRIIQPGPETPDDAGLRGTVAGIEQRVDEALETVAFSTALDQVWALVRQANLYVDKTAPWRLREEADRPRLARVLYQVLETMRILALVLSPFIPTAARGIWQQLGLTEAPEVQRFSSAAAWGGLPVGIQTRRGQPLFPRIKA